MKNIKLILLFLIIINLSACAIVPEKITAAPEQETAAPEQKTARTLILGGKQFKENKPGEFTSWKCRDYSYGGKTLVEVGKLTLSDDYKKRSDYKEIDDSAKKVVDDFIKMTGFVLYDGTNTGDFTFYKRRGINHRWDWGTEGGSYSFIINPDGTGSFYDFSSSKKGEKIKADDIYKCSR